MRKASFKVTGMHCSEEIAVLKRVLSAHPGIETLDFDLIQSKMIVTYDSDKLGQAEISDLVASTGMEAMLWEKRFLAEKKVRRERRLRVAFTLIGFSLLLAGGLIQFLSLKNGPTLSEAFDSAQKSSPPFISVRLYFISILFGAYFVLPKAWMAIRKKRADMNLLMVIAVIGAALIGEWSEGATVANLFSLALLLEEWSVTRARRAIEGLLNMAPPFARCLTAAGIIEKRVEEVDIGTRIEVRPGERVPLDGVVVEGYSSVDQSPITGESTPVAKDVGSECFAGTINEEGRLIIESTKRAEQTALARIIELVEEASHKRAPSEQWVERFARIYTPAMIALAFGIMLLPPLIGGQPWVKWIYEGLVIAVIACPCSLVISTPVSIVSALTSSARAGVLIKGGRFLELFGKLRAIALDKTGTLTEGRPAVQRIIPLYGHSEEELLLRAAALERPSTHPLAKAILKQAENLKIPDVQDFQMHKGKGASGKIHGKKYWIGSHRFLHEMGQETEEIHKLALELEDEGHSVVAIGSESHVCGLISIADMPRESIEDTLLALKEEGIQSLIMVTGDNAPSAHALAAKVGLTEVYAELLPEDKVDAIARLTQKYRYVAMVGDGVNDAPAMARATIGIAMGAAGTDVAIETADVALMSDDLGRLPWLIRHSRRTLRVIQQNITFSLSIKTLFIVLALLGHASLWLAIAADTGAAFCVILNGLRLLKR